MHIEPIACVRPTWNAASTFATMPYDLYDGAEARQFVLDNSKSFLAIDRPESNYPEGQVPEAPVVFKKALELLRERISDGTLIQDDVPCFYVWQQETHGHAQIGIACSCSVNDYKEGVIRKHEGTLPDKVRYCERYLVNTGIQGGPLFLTYREEAGIDGVVAACMSQRPLYGFIDLTGCRNTVWRVSEPTVIARIKAIFSDVPQAYIADGHHRAEASSVVDKEFGGSNSPNDYVLSVLIPDNQLHIQPYDRVLQKLNIPACEVLARVREKGIKVTKFDCPVEPQEPYTYGMYVGGCWYHLSVGEVPMNDDPVSKLDVTVLERRVFADALGLHENSDDCRIKYVGGANAALKAAVKAGNKGCAFTLRPTPIEAVMDVADAGMQMPPKSTWFEPKLLSGLFIRILK